VDLQGKISIVFDALDKCVKGQKYLLKILQKTWREEMPAWVGTAQSARPQDRISVVIREAKPFIINMDGEASKEVMRVFLGGE